MPYIPAYKQMQQGFKSLEMLLLSFDQWGDNTFNEKSTMFMTKSRNGSYCGLMSFDDIDIEDFGLEWLDIELLTNQPQSDDEIQDRETSQCETQAGGIVNQGIIISNQKLINDIVAHVELISQYPGTDDSVVAGIVNSNLFENYDFFVIYTNRYIDELIEVLIENSGEIIGRELNYLRAITIGNICFLALFGLVGWLKFLSIVNKKLNKTKKLLNILPSSVLVHNVYIRNFLLNENKTQL